MKKKIFVLSLMTVLTVAACGNSADTENENALSENTVYFYEDPAESRPAQTEPESGAEIADEYTQDAETGTEISQGGPYGEISLTLPAGWTYELCPVGNDKLQTGLYGILFYPEGQTRGYIELFYTERFGVCGTGLAETTVALAKDLADIGTYDGHDYWNFVSFRGRNEGIVALTYDVTGWWTQYGDQASEILDTLCFNPNVKEGSASVYYPDSEVEEIGLHLGISNISSTKATLHFDQYGDAPTGELQFGAEFTIEKSENGKWVEVPVAAEENYGFESLAYVIPGQGFTEYELDWEWLYGELAPGEYRIGKKINDFRGTGDYDSYMIYAHFILN